MKTIKFVTIKSDVLTKLSSLSKEVLWKKNRKYIGIYDDETGWYIPFRTDLKRYRKSNTFMATPIQQDGRFKTNERPGLDYQKALFLNVDDVEVIQTNELDTFQPIQIRFVEENASTIKKKFEEYVLHIASNDPNSTVNLFPEGIQFVKKQIQPSSKNKNTDIDINKSLHLLNDIGIEVIDSGNHFALKGSDGAKLFKNGRFTSFSHEGYRGVGLYGLGKYFDLKKADVDELLKDYDPEAPNNLKTSDIESLSLKKQNVVNPAEFLYEDKNKLDSVISYLVDQRKISNQTLNMLIKNDLLSADKKGNALFKWYDVNGNLIGGDRKPDTRSVKGSNTGIGFNFRIPPRKVPDSFLESHPKVEGLDDDIWSDEYDFNNSHVAIHFFESSIDAISYYEIYKNELDSELEHRFVSVSGVSGAKKNVEYWLQHATANKNSGLSVVEYIEIAFDNDEPGRKASEALKTTYKNIHQKIIESFPDNSLGKDWNDVLQKPQENELRKDSFKSMNINERD